MILWLYEGYAAIIRIIYSDTDPYRSRSPKLAFLTEALAALLGVDDLRGRLPPCLQVLSGGSSAAFISAWLC